MRTVGLEPHHRLPSALLDHQVEDEEELIPQLFFRNVNKVSGHKNPNTDLVSDTLFWLVLLGLGIASNFLNQCNSDSQCSESVNHDPIRFSSILIWFVIPKHDASGVKAYEGEK